MDGSGGGYGFDSGIDFNQWFGPGTYTVFANYGGFGLEDCEVDSSSASATVVVPGPQASAVTTSASPASAREGQPVAITATITSATGYETGPNPTGTVLLFFGNSVLTSHAISPLDTVSGNAGEPISSSVTFTLPTAGIAPGTYTLDAVYNGDTNLTSSSAPVTVIITASKVTTATALTASPITTVVGQSIAFTSIVTPSVSGITPTGTVTFKVGTLTLGTGKLNSSGMATFTLATAGLPVGVWPVTASYGGDQYNDPSTSSAQNVTLQAATTTTVTADPKSAAPGGKITFTANVARAGASGTPTGTVAFQFDTYTIGTGTLNGSGVTTSSFSTNGLPAGSYTINAVYSGDSLDTTSTSAPITVTIQ